MTQTQSKDRPFLSELEPLSFRPVFIMGVQRSGTSILYKLLQKTDYFTVTTAYHIVCFDELLYNQYHQQEKHGKQHLAELIQQGEQVNRGIDELSITPDFPEEYGFLLSRKTGIQYLQHNTIDLFTLLCKKVTNLSENEKPLLLKNPFDFSRFLYIKKHFPPAQFIFIHRHPLNTLSSQLNAMQTLLKKKSSYMALLSPWYQHIYKHPLLRSYYRFASSPHNPLRVKHLIDTFSSHANRFLLDIQQLQKQCDYISIRYEDLCRFPQETMQSILSFLGYTIPSTIHFSDYVKPRNPPVRKQIKKQKKKIKKNIESYLSYHDYEI